MERVKVGVGQDATARADHDGGAPTPGTVALAEAFTAMAEAQDIGEVGEVVIEALRTHLHIDAAGVGVLDESNGVLAPVAQYGFSDGMIDAYKTRGAGPDAPIRRTLESGEFRSWGPAEFVAEFPELAALMRDEGFRRVSVQPFVTRGRLVGGATIALRRDRPPSAVDRTFLATLSMGAASTMQRLHAIETGRRRTEEAEALARMTRGLMDATSLDEIGYLSWREGAAQLGAQRGAFFMIDWAASELVQVGEPGLSQSLKRASARMPLTLNTVATECALTGRPIVVATMDEYLKRYPEAVSTILGGTGDAVPAAAIGAPVRGRDRVIGSLVFAFLEPRMLSERDIWLANSFADSTAAAFERLQFFLAEQATRKDADALARASAALFEAEDPSEVGRIVLEETRAATGAFSGTITLFDPNDDTFFSIATFGGPAQLAPTARRPLSENSVVGEVMRTGATVVIEGADEYARRYPEFAAIVREGGCRALMGAPLIVRGRTIGAFSLAFNDRDRIVPHELALLESIGSMAAEAIDRVRAHRLIDAVIAQMPVGVAVFDPRGRVQAINDQVARLWRGRAAAGGGEDSWQGVGPDGTLPDAASWPIWQSLRTGETVIGQDLELNRPDGSSATLELTSAAIRDEHGTIVGGVALVSDVTGRVEAERAREAFLAVLSHEMRTPITAILLATRQLMARGQDLPVETSRELLGDLEAEAERLNRVVGNLLVLSRVERGAPFAESEPGLLQHLLPSIFRAEEKLWPGVQFRLDLPARLPMVQLEPGYFEQVVRNLMANAAKYGGPSVLVSARLAGDDVQIRVRDWGPGVRPEDRQRVFDLFYRAPGMSRSAVGAGIGLFVVRNLVESMGGRVWVESMDEPGACLVVAFPSVHADEA